MRYLLLFAMIIFLTACNSESKAPGQGETAVLQDSIPPVPPKEATAYLQKLGNTKDELEIVNNLLKLDFVLKSNLYIDSLTEHRQGISFIKDSTGGNAEVISILAGYNGPQRFETYYHFYLNTKTKEIKVYDPVSDKALSVKEYLKTLK